MKKCHSLLTIGPFATSLVIACVLEWASMSAVAQAADFKLSSPDLVAGKPMADKFIYSGMGCKGGNISPALTWTDPPPETRSFALMVHDPDAPTGGAGIWHWVVIDIPASSRAIAQGAGKVDVSQLPAGSRQIRNDYETAGWSGPCPPVGKEAHKYNFTLYALSVPKVEVSSDATASHAGFLINKFAIGKSVLSATYAR